MNVDTVSTEIGVAHGHDTSPSDATAPVMINKAERSALAFKAHADRSPGQVQIIEVPRLRTVEARN
jgi:hypothetical protein